MKDIEGKRPAFAASFDRSEESVPPATARERCGAAHDRRGAEVSREHHGECAGTGARLGIDHVLSHSRHRQCVVMPMVVACVSTALPWQNGHIAGRVPPSTERVSGTVIVSSARRVEWHEVDVDQNDSVREDLLVAEISPHRSHRQ